MANIAIGSLLTRNDMEAPTAVDLAKAFIDKMIDAFTGEEWTLMIDRNRVELNPRTCHSHDFCDANQVMLDAMDSLGIPYEGIDWNDDNSVTRIVNEAWTIVWAAEFNADRIDDELLAKIDSMTFTKPHRY